MQITRSTLAIAIAAVFFGCAKSPHIADEIRDGLKAHSGVSRVINEFTRRDQKYQGFYNLYDVHITMLNSLVHGAINERGAYYLKWDNDQLREERDKSFQEMSTQSTFMVSLFTPDRNHNDADKTGSMWKVYLEANGMRYTGEIERVKTKLTQLQAIYPYHSRFSVMYRVTFPVPMVEAEKHSTKVIFTSNLGTSTFIFPAVP